MTNIYKQFEVAAANKRYLDVLGGNQWRDTYNTSFTTSSAPIGATTFLASNLMKENTV